MTVLAFITTYLRVKAFYLSSPALVLPFGYVTVVLGMSIDILVLDADYNLITILGMALTSTGLFSKLILDRVLPKT